MRPLSVLDPQARPVLANLAVLVPLCLLSAAAMPAIRYLPATAQPACVAVLILVVIGCTAWWFGRLDEAAREAHKAAWFWGGLTAMAPVLGVLTYLKRTHAADWVGPMFLGRHAADPAALLSLGVALCFIGQCAGYAVVWTVWWLKRR